MAVDLSDRLVIGISATALFDLAEAAQVFDEKAADDPDSAIEAYRQYMLERENDLLDDGTGLPLVKALLQLNDHTKSGEPPVVEVVVMSRNSPETGIRVLNTIRQRKLGISRSAFTAGESVTPYLKAFSVDLFLTTNVEDVQTVIDSKVCSAAMLSPPPEKPVDIPEDQVRIAFDGDAVLFDEESELIYQNEGLEAFHAAEDSAQDVPLSEGPHFTFLKKLATIQDRLPMRVEYSPIRIALITARNSPAEMRVIKTLRNWGIYVDEAFFLGGVEKHAVLRAFKPHIFFDDQDVHLQDAAAIVPSGRVPYQTKSMLAPSNNVSQDGEASS